MANIILTCLIFFVLIIWPSIKRKR